MAIGIYKGGELTVTYGVTLAPNLFKFSCIGSDISIKR
jgi:hypothetical protein